MQLMQTNASLTIYNRVPNVEKKCFEYKKHFIPEVHFFTDQKVEVGDVGLKSADVYKIRIPGESLDGYAPSNEPLLAEKWTIEKDDLFVLGDGPAQIEGKAELTRMHKPYGMVKSWSDNRRGRNPHIRIGGAV